jgi:hypothetical protein
MGRKVARVTNSRQIVEHDPVGSYTVTWYTVELRGPLFRDEPTQCWTGPFFSLADAIADAERRGPMPDGPEISN